MKDKLHDVTLIAYILLAAAGGVARYLSRFLITGKFRWAILVAHVFISAFSGLMFAELAMSPWVNVESPHLIAVFAGIGGFMGTKALEYMEEQLVSHFPPLPPKEEDKPLADPK